ncbi:MAG: hypothetical protein QXO82_05295 [Candidatus Methanomethylicia archaeon]
MDGVDVNDIGMRLLVGSHLQLKYQPPSILIDLEKFSFGEA